MRIVIKSLLVVLIVSVAALALAADPQPKKPSEPPARTDGQATPDLDINQAEITAGVVPDATDGVKSQPDQTAVSPMITEIFAIRDASRLEIADLTAQAPAHPDHAAELALQQQISQLKQQTELDILAIQVRYARSAGQEDLALQIEADIAAIISPPQPAPPAEARPAPNTQH